MKKNRAIRRTGRRSKTYKVGKARKRTWKARQKGGAGMRVFR